MNLRICLIGLVIAQALFSTEPGNAASFETLVMPGKVIEGHAEIESECSSCHQAFARNNQRVLCLDCHEDVALDIKRVLGYHGKFPDAAKNACSSCHTDHEGRDADIVHFDEDNFDHKFTDFGLLGEHAELPCSDCHREDKKYRDASKDCSSCHDDEDNEHGDFGATFCGDCHVSSAWEDIEFDHDTTDFRLIGKHQDVVCVDCHADLTFEYTPNTCYGCHEKDDAHNGRSGKECDDCHNPTDWTDTSFDHDTATEFPLQGRHAELTCDDCHSDNPFADKLKPVCISCHRDDDAHEGGQGIVCNDCHNESSWEDNVFFDHDLTQFPLLGKHATTDCEGCHDSHVFNDAPEDCLGCHSEDNPHERRFGKDCGLCHNPVEWENWQFDHDTQSDFFLDGVHVTVVCEDCHRQSLSAMKKMGSRCTDCHRADDIHDGEFGYDCGRCHSASSFRDVRSIQ